MELEELKRKHKEMGDVIAKLEQTPEFWEPTNGEQAWYIGTYTGTVKSADNWSTTEIEIGLAFQTQELTEQALAIQLATQRLKKAIFYLNKGKSYPFSVGASNYCITLTDEMLSANSWYNNKFAPNWMYMKNKAACEQLIAEHKDDLLLVLGQ